MLSTLASVPTEQLQSVSQHEGVNQHLQWGREGALLRKNPGTSWRGGKCKGRGEEPLSVSWFCFGKIP